ncbi:MAG: TRAP transporter small permease subunit [Alphaproteobacteria bacterium]|nr:TRAP transporter small permease subunit [Alphaproteobacteria bacterium]
MLLFLQWPLRDLVRAFSREANDLAQWLFAVYVAIALTVATSARAHLAADALARRFTPSLRRGLAVAGALVLLVWGGFLLLTLWPIVAQSVRGREAFPDTGNPLYFMVKVAAALLAGLVVVQAVRTLLRRAS